MGLDSFFSYRDPSVDATLERYLSAGAWLVVGPSDTELEGYSRFSRSRRRQFALEPSRADQDIERFNGRPTKIVLSGFASNAHTITTHCQAFGASPPTDAADTSIVFDCKKRRGLPADMNY